MFKSMEFQRVPSNNEERASREEPQKQRTKVYKWEIRWPIIILFIFNHSFSFYGLYLILSFQVKFLTIMWITFYTIMTGMGVTAGAHRLWSHRAYKAKWPMKLILMIFHSAAFQQSIYRWVQNHRLHHKYIDTDADPYNAKRGFFFSHMGWILIRKHPDFIKKNSINECNDIKQDPFVMFQYRWYAYVMLSFCYILPTLIPYYCWNETLLCAWCVNLVRYLVILHGTCSINSFAHMYGMRPYDKSISATQNLAVSSIMFGEGWHNYHHTFPCDYRAEEFGNYKSNIATAFIDLCAFLGLAYNLKTVSSESIEQRIKIN